MLCSFVRSFVRSSVRPRLDLQKMRNREIEPFYKKGGIFARAEYEYLGTTAVPVSAVCYYCAKCKKKKIRQSVYNFIWYFFQKKIRQSVSNFI